MDEAVMYCVAVCAQCDTLYLYYVLYERTDLRSMKPRTLEGEASRTPYGLHNIWLQGELFQYPPNIDAAI